MFSGFRGRPAVNLGLVLCLPLGATDLGFSKTFAYFSIQKVIKKIKLQTRFPETDFSADEDIETPADGAPRSEAIALRSLWICCLELSAEASGQRH